MSEGISLARGGRTYVGGVVAAGAAVIAFSVVQLVAVPPHPYWLILALLTVMTGPLSIRVPSSRATISVSDTFVFASLVWFGPAAAAVTIAIDGFVVSLRGRRRSLSRGLFNIAEPAVSIWLAGQLFFALTGETPLFGRSVPFGPMVVPLLAMTTSYFLFNTGFMLTALWFETGRPPARFLRANLAHLGLVFFANMLLVGLLVLNSNNVGFTAFGVLVPVLVFTYAVSKLAIDRRETMDALRVSEGRFRELAENINEVLWTVDADTHKVLYMSPAYRRIWGQAVASADLAGIDRFEHVHPDDQLGVRQAFTTGAVRGTFDIEYRVVHPDGELRWIHDRGFPVTDSDGQVRRVVGIAEDMTGRRQLEQQLLQARKMEGIGRMAGGIAHDFRNILTAILGYAELVLDQLDERDPSWAATLKIRQASGRAAELTSQLLAFSRQQVLRLEVIDVNNLVRGVEDMVQRLIGEDVTIDAHLADTLAYVKADAAQLEQVIVNLASNARDAMPGGGCITITTTNMTLEAAPGIDDEPVEPGHYVVLQVGDTGTGMDERTRARIFEPFFTSKEQGKGTGLGLATVYGTVKQLGGHISVDSELGEGTRFSIFLPRTDEMLQGVAAPAEKPIVPKGTEMVLLVEDEDAVRGYVRTVLRRAGYQVVEAPDSSVALELTEGLDTAVDLLVTDIIMPGMSGTELAAELKRRHAGLPVVYISGYGSANVEDRGMDTAGDALLEKPFGPDALLNAVRAALDTARHVPAVAPAPGP
jgi:PAS domain S-box-containing protein